MTFNLYFYSKTLLFILVYIFKLKTIYSKYINELSIVNIKQMQLNTTKERQFKKYLINFDNFFYNLNLNIGSQYQRQRLIMNLNGHYSWITSKECFNCGLFSNSFIPSNSLTYKAISKVENLKLNNNSNVIIINGTLSQDTFAMIIRKSLT